MPSLSPVSLLRTGEVTCPIKTEKALAKQMLSRDLEKFKADLQRESQAEIAKLRASLEMEQERFRWLQGRRGEAIELTHTAYLAALTAVETAESLGYLRRGLGLQGRNLFTLGGGRGNGR